MSAGGRDRKMDQTELKNLLTEQRMLTRCAETLNDNGNLDRQIDQVLSDMGNYYRAERVYIFRSRKEEPLLDNIYEWCADGIQPQSSELHGLDIRPLERWRQAFRKKEALIEPDVSGTRTLFPDEYAFMTKHGICSYIEAPLFYRGEFTGFLGLDNPDASMIGNSAESILTMAYSISNALIRGDIRQEREESRRRYEVAVEGAELAVWEYDIAEQCLRHPSSRLLRYHIPETVRNFPAVVFPLVQEEDRERLHALYARVDAGENMVSGDFWMRWSPDAPLVCEHVIYSVQKNKEGKPTLAYGISVDVTAEKLEQRRFRSMLQELFAANPRALGMLHVNLTRNLCSGGHSASPFVEAATRARTLDEFVIIASAHIPDEAERKEFLERFTCEKLIRAFNAGRNDLQFEYRRTGGNGRPFWMRTYIRMLRNPETNDIEGVIYSTDITHEKQQNEILHIITEQEYDLIAIIHIAERTVEAVYLGTEVPDAYRELLPQPGAVHPLENFRRNAMEKWICPEDIREYKKNSDPAYYIPLMDRTGRSEFTIRENFPDKGRIYRRFQHYYLGGDRDTILVIESDVSETYRRQQAELQKERMLREEAMAASKAKTDFLSRMSHDIRTPLNGIIGMAYLAEQHENEPYTADCLAKISTSAKFLLGLINNVLDMAKIESGKAELHCEPYPVHEMNSYLDAVIRPLCEERKQKFILEESIEADNIPLVDKNYINQILFNLLSNAVKFTPEGGTVSCSVSKKCIADNRAVIEYKVADTGIGISREFRKQIFEAFTQEGRDDASDQRGSGLGLSIVKKLVDLMGGTISLDSEIGHGTTFTVRLECSTAAAEPDGTRSSTDDAASAVYTGLRGKRILLCEDHPLNREIAGALLAQQGIVMDSAENGEIGVKRFLLSKPYFYDAVLMDIRMPAMDGYEAAGQIRALCRPDAGSIPIIAMTADAFEESIRKAKEIGMNDYITKPIEPQKLYEILKKHIAPDS